MVEQDRRIYTLLEKNVADLGCETVADTLRGDALGSVSLLRAPRPLDVIFVDPPFAMMQDEASRGRVLDHIARAADMLAPDGMVVLRTPLDARAVSHEVSALAGPEVREYRRHHHVLFYTHRGAAS
jgi:16S rRNA G966 N2-methylase RsmD